MDAKQYKDGLAELRGLRGEIKKAEAALGKLTVRRDRVIAEVASYPKARADQLAPAAGLSVRDIVELASHLSPATAETPEDATPDRKPAPQPVAEESGAPAPHMPPVAAHQPTETTAPDQDEAVDEPDTGAEEPPADTAVEAVAVTPVASAPEPDAGTATDAVPRGLPVIPEGAEGDRWFSVVPGLRSKRPDFTQQSRPTVFLDASTGDLLFGNQRVRLDLGSASAGEILTSVFAHAPATTERIFITTGAPWHRDADRHPYLRDAVGAWLEAPMPDGWRVESRRGKDALAGHFLHERNPVGRWERGEQHVEIRSVAEWFDPDGTDVATIRHAFVLLGQALKRIWPDVVLLGSPSQTGRDLWQRTLPTKQGSRWADGYPVMSDEIRQLLHATAGQGRTELIAPPRVPDPLPALYELDRTLAYGKHTWTSGVGEPERVTAQKFASWSEKQQSDTLFKPSHWRVKVTIPDDWNHVGILPFAIEGERAWIYPHEGGRTFTTWAGGAEINLALRNPLKQPWRIEILDGLLWESGTPLREWSEKLKKAWVELGTAARVAGDDELRTAYRLASRAVRSILLYGIGGFAQRPTITTGAVQLGQENQIPKGARIKTIEGQTVFWERTQMRRNPNAHPEWAAGVWSAARAALLSTSVKTNDGQKTHVGALHLPGGSIVAIRTDALYTTVRPDWPYRGDPGDYLLKGVLPHPTTAPVAESDFYTLQSLGRVYLEEQQDIASANL
ncbi:Mucin-19 [Streptomyces sp. NPDC002817]|uniref:Mucin-19 n=1 Tax=Streptomyces sp. NPDC088357 TaxID=3154655 RepID=UPI00343891E1